MRHYFLFLTLILFSTTILSQSNCSKYYPMEEGTTFQYTMYNKKGKTDGVSDYKVVDIKNTDGETSAIMQTRFTDNKGKLVFESNYGITCTGEGIKIDYKSLFPSQMMKQYTEMGLEMDITGTDIEIPNTLTVGEVLKDANVAVAMNMSGMKMNITVDMTGRKVEKKENITTSAGTFNCYLITETNNSKTMGMNQEINSKIWLSEGVGLVKQEMYKKNGELMSSMELTQFSK